ncbi:hypothetical protein P167DRAFT_552212 [Morchella conica CCBAS932]|uniref:DUF7603 domain-containing protein n=1 Tax=Morchella conica CCBAS932 TaxID=1392247 RepID=A0A3N4KWM3_9PEZI|nr:hypothetical protein P167DRAFT_552212 [Morchella conica CCBAS932]
MDEHGPSTLPSLPPQSPPRPCEQLESPPFSSNSLVRRKPLLPSGGNQSPSLQQSLNKKSSSNRAQGLLEHSPPLDSGGIVIRDLDKFPHGDSPNLGQGRWAADSHGEFDIRVQLPTPRVYPPSPLTSHTSHARVWSESSVNKSNQHIDPPHRRPASTMASSSAASDSSPTIPANLNLPDVPFRSRSPSISETTEEANKPPRSPSARITSFLRWGSASDQGGIVPLSPSTSISERPAPSPKSTNTQQLYSSSRSIPPAIDIPRANAAVSDGLHSDSGVSFAPQTPSAIDAIEQEVRLVSADLAASIRREMELEDLIERLQAEAAERNGESKRTSDYFSDAGTSTRYLDSETKQEVDVDKMQRKAEQDISRVRLEMLSSIQEERERRKAVEARVKEMEEQSARRESAQFLTAGSSGRVKELEVGLEDARRRLAEERQMKENYEDLLTALRGELEELRNERDNLRDEIVPRLRARVEGLESETSELQKEEHSKMQQELLNLRNENASLASAIQVQASAIQTSAVQKQARQSIIGRPSRPVSLMGSPISTMPLALDFKDRETLAEKVKGIEEQRDALHSALKSLQERHRYENKRAKERIRALELERDKALQQTNRRYGKDREMSTIRKEMERLRRRADEAIESKVRCEKNLGTLKMDLEQAETETATLRALLQEHDSLAHSESQRAITKLMQGVAQVEAERDEAQVEAEAYRKRAESLQNSEKKHLAEERSLSIQLKISTERIGELAAQVRSQLESNNSLRDRLAEAIGRGEEDQKLSAQKINELQERLRVLEDKVLEAQQQTEEAVARHEEEVRKLKDTHTSQLRRLKTTAMGSPTGLAARSPLSPMLRSPRLEWTGFKKPSQSIPDSSRIEYLEKRVDELEKALGQADNEMAEVVGKMNTAQIEVMELQNERDESLRKTRKLQAEIEIERANFIKSV